MKRRVGWCAHSQGERVIVLLPGLLAGPASEMLPFSLGHRLAIKPLTRSGTPRKRFERTDRLLRRPSRTSRTASRDEKFFERGNAGILSNEYIYTIYCRIDSRILCILSKDSRDVTRKLFIYVRLLDKCL